MRRSVPTGRPPMREPSASQQSSISTRSCSRQSASRPGAVEGVAEAVRGEDAAGARADRGGERLERRVVGVGLDVDVDRHAARAGRAARPWWGSRRAGGDDLVAGLSGRSCRCERRGRDARAGWPASPSPTSATLRALGDLRPGGRGTRRAKRPSVSQPSSAASTSVRSSGDADHLAGDGDAASRRARTAARPRRRPPRSARPRRAPRRAGRRDRARAASRHRVSGRAVQSRSSPPCSSPGWSCRAMTALHGIQPNDEGLMLQAVERIVDGAGPLPRLLVVLPPGQPYLLGGLHELSGPSLLTWRIVRVLADATVAVLAYSLARRGAGPRLRRSPAWAAAILAMAYPSGPHPFPIALALALGALLAFERRPALAGVLVGAAAAWRIEFAAFARAARCLRRAARAGCAGSRLAAVADGRRRSTCPVVIAAGSGRSWDLLVDYPLTGLPRLPDAAVPALLRRPAEHRAHPAASSRTAPSRCRSTTCRSRSSSGSPRRGGRAALGRPLAPRVIATGVFTLGALAYLLVRTDLFHTAPLAVMVAILAAWALAERPRLLARRAGRAARDSRSSSRSPRGSTAAGSYCARTPSRSTCRSPTACGCRRGRRRSWRRSSARLRPPRRADLRRDPPLRPRDLGPPAPVRAGRAGRTRPATTSRRRASSPPRRCSARSSATSSAPARRWSCAGPTP